ncbi:MAG: hypothetical protein Q7S28_00015 [bacterium]|nr:hypothetical protein [bacterium]
MIPCKKCGVSVGEADYFCPQCGAHLKNKPPSTGLWMQIGVYALSIFLPPLGLWPAWKYWVQPDRKSKNIAIATLILNIVSLAVNVWLGIKIFNDIGSMINLQGF